MVAEYMSQRGVQQMSRRMVERGLAAPLAIDLGLDAVADVQLAVGDLDSAVEKYRRCVEVDPEFFDGWHALGMALMKTDRVKEAQRLGAKSYVKKPYLAEKIGSVIKAELDN